jgi:hypothetical protein
MTPNNDVPPSENTLDLILAILDKLSLGASPEQVAADLSISPTDISLYFKRAADIIRISQTERAVPLRKWPARGSILDWRAMTVAEALEILADHTKTTPGDIAPDKTNEC